jgi:hypothetical protein
LFIREAGNQRYDFVSLLPKKIHDILLRSPGRQLGALDMWSRRQFLAQAETDDPLVGSTIGNMLSFLSRRLHAGFGHVRPALRRNRFDETDQCLRGLEESIYERCNARGSIPINSHDQRRPACDLPSCNEKLVNVIVHNGESVSQVDAVFSRRVRACRGW